MWNIQVYGLSNMLVLLPNDIVVLGALVQIWSIYVLLIVVLSEKECFNLYLYIRFWNVVDWSVFFKHVYMEISN
jgi:hypothetical protein